jgi:hypothetical protein
MASLREAFQNPDVAQGNFYSAQQIRYQQVEPNRFLPDAMKGNLGPTIANDALSQFDKYDPYTESVSNRFSAAGLSQLLQGQKDTTDEETYCRGFTGAASISKLQSDQEAQGNLPVRCGWRYKKSPGGGAPLVSQGALGTQNGPLNAREDSLGNGVEWIWDLKQALNRHVRDLATTLPASPDGLATGQANIQNLAFCSQTNSYILVDSAGNALPGYTCATNNIVTNPSQFPQVTQTSVNSLLTANTSLAASCSRPGNNPSLSRDCLLQAITTNGCSSDGTLYQALQAANPSSQDMGQFLRTQPVFLTYQSRQGANAITESLFNRESGSWDLATQEIQKLQRYTQLNQDPLVKKAAEDLCTNAGIFDTYDFCADLADSTSIGGVELRCMQNYWQEKNGKPAGLLYPTTKQLKPELGTINTWGEYRTAVDQLKTKISSTDPIEQRRAINNFLGVTVSENPFSPLNLDNLAQQFSLGGQPLSFWLDAKDGGSLTIDQNNRVFRWNDKSGTNRNTTQSSIANRPTFRQEANPGIEFDGVGNFLEIPNAYSMVTGNFTVFVVERRKSSKVENYFLGGTTINSQNNNLVLGYALSNLSRFAFWANDVDASIPTYQNTLEPTRIWMFEKNSTGRQIFLNGTRANGDANLSSLRGWTGAAVGRYYTRYYQGVIHEILIFNTSLTTDRRQKMEGYLAHKWGLTGSLPSNHPFKASAP